MSRLDDIRSRAVFLKRSDGEFSDIIQLDVNDYAYLYEQAERIPMLETSIKRLRDRVNKLGRLEAKFECGSKKIDDFIKEIWALENRVDRHKQALESIKGDIETDYTEQEIDNSPLLTVILEQIDQALKEDRPK